MVNQIYGTYNFFTWFRSEFIDTIPKQALLALDKSYVDYDYGHSSGGNRNKGKKMSNEEFMQQLEKNKKNLDALMTRK